MLVAGGIVEGCVSTVKIVEEILSLLILEVLAPSTVEAVRVISSSLVLGVILLVVERIELIGELLVVEKIFGPLFVEVLILSTVEAV